MDEDAADNAKMISTNQLQQKDILDHLHRQGRKLNTSFLQKDPYKVVVKPESASLKYIQDIAGGRRSAPPEGWEQKGPRPTTHGAVKLSYTQKLHQSFKEREPKPITPGTARRGLPLPDYPWATPERTGMGYLEPPKTGWKATVNPPWIYKDGDQALATDLDGLVLPGWQGRRRPGEGKKPPWFEEKVEWQPRHDRVENIMSQVPREDPETLTGGKQTLCTAHQTECINMRATGGKLWQEYFMPNDPILQRGEDAYARGQPLDRDILNLTKRLKRVDEGTRDDRPVNRPIQSRAKGVRRKPRKNNWISEARATQIAPKDSKQMERMRGVQVMNKPDKKTLARRAADPLKLCNRRGVYILKEGSSNPDEYMKAFGNPGA